MQLGGYLEKIDLGADPKTRLPNILVESAAEYHALPSDDKKRAWALVKVAAQLLHLGPVAIYQRAAEGKIASQTIKKNAGDKKGLTFIQIEPALTDHTQARVKDKQRVLRRLKRVLRGTWWFNSDSELFLLFIVNHELNRVEASEFGTVEEQRNALFERYTTMRWLTEVALAPVKEKFGPEEAARLADAYVRKYGSNNYQLTEEAKHEGNNEE